MITGSALTGQCSSVGALSVERLAATTPVEPPPACLDEALTVADVYRAHFDFVWRTARRMRIAEHRIDDVVQDVFVVVHRRLGDFDGRGSLRSWLYGIVQRTVRDHRRHARRKEAPLASDVVDERGEERFPSSFPRPDDAAAASEGLSLVERMLDRMAPEKSEVLMLSYLEGMAVPEIAECVCANVNTVYSRLRSGRQELEAMLRAHEKGALL